MKKLNFKLVVTLLVSVILMSCDNQSTQEIVEDDNSNDNIEEVVSDEEYEIPTFDWIGVYKGTLPCADCEGIETVVKLNNDLTYNKEETYMKGETTTFSDEGGIRWDEANEIITLISMNDTISRSYKIEDAQIRALDLEGNIIEGELADFYILKKE